MLRPDLPQIEWPRANFSTPTAEGLEVKEISMEEYEAVVAERANVSER